MAWDAWRTEIRAIGVTNPLISYEVDSFSQIDLDRAHPGGMAQFTSTGATTLTNLMRDPLNFSNAFSAAKRIDAKNRQLREHYGLETCFLVGGLIGLEADGFDLRMPILLWPIRLIRTGEDFEVLQNGAPIVNPALADNLEICYGINLNEAKMLSLVAPKSDLVPIAVLEYLAELVGENAKAELKSVLALGNFTTAPSAMLAEIKNFDHPVLNYLASEHEPARLGQVLTPLAKPVADADETQRRIMARAVAGESFAVETLPGCGYTQTVVNLLASLTSAQRRTLVLAPRRQTLQELGDRLSSIGLGGLLVRSESVWMDVIAAISRNEKSRETASGKAAVDLADIASKLGDYFGGLRAVDATLGVSILDVLEKLAQLAAMPHAPETSARVARTSLLSGQNRENALALLAKAQELGEFNYGPQDSAWFQARFENPADVEATLAVVKRLREDTFPALSAKLQEFIAAVEFKPAASVAEMGVYLRLFQGLRESLDRFLPSVYDRNLAEMIEATNARSGRGELSGGTRRRLKKLAKEFIRPGMHVADLNASLRAIDEQRTAWQQHCLGLKPPAVPNGINDAMVAYQSLLVDLNLVQRHLDPASSATALADLPLAELAAKLDSLATDVGALDNLGERAMVANDLRAMGLEELMRDLARLHASREHLASEYDLAWWQSALEYLAQRSPQVLSISADDLDRLEEKFRDANLAVLAENVSNLAGRLGEIWRSDIAEHGSEAAVLKALLKSGSASFAQLATAAPHIVANLAPNYGMSPYEVAELLTRGEKFDTLVVLDAAGTTIAENLSGFLRAEQVITFGDDAIAAPTGFEIEALPIPLKREPAAPSIQSVIAEHYGCEVLRRSYRTNGQILGSFINREFYQNRIVFEPTTDDYWGNSHVSVEVITDGANANSLIAGANQSLDAEVDKAVEVIYNHALWHPEDSLLFATASAMHADRVRTAVYAGLKNRQNLLEFFEGHGRERFEVATLSSLGHRVADHVVFSLGFGKSPRGALIGDLGDLTATDGRRWLANLLVSARKQITVVSCYSAAELPSDATNGVAHLRDLLAGGVRVEESTSDLDGDAMLSDLAIRLRKLGVTVKSDFGNNLTMVISYGNRAIELQPDWLVAQRDLTQELYLRPRLLAQLGWTLQRVHAFDLFVDPDSYAKNLARALGMQIRGESQASSFSDVVKFEDTDAGWGDYSSSNQSGNDARLKQDKPPHWA